MPTVEAIDLYRVRIPLLTPFRTAYGCDDAVEPVLVRMEGGGLVGWGEAQAFRHPTYCPEFGAGIFITLRDVLAPRLLGQDLAVADDLHRRIAAFKGNPFARGALDMAWWDLYAKSLRMPLWKALGGVRETITVGADFGAMESLDALLAKVDAAVQAGFARVKLKFCPGWDVDMVHTVRSAFPKLKFHIDCNSAYTLKDLEMFRRLDRYGLAMIEQPLAHDDLLDHATLARQIETPICLDESITSVEKARKAIEARACRWVNIKPVRVGGLTAALKINALCASAGIPCWVGGMLETAIGASHCAAMATVRNMGYPCDVFPSSRFFKEDLGRPELFLSGPSTMTLPAGIGLGAEPDPEMLDRLTVERASLRR
jgi:O-succinylbenzoate synthase